MFAVNIEYVTLSQIRKKSTFVYMFLVNKHETCSISHYPHNKITHYDGVLRFYKATYTGWSLVYETIIFNLWG